MKHNYLFIIALAASILAACQRNDPSTPTVKPGEDPEVNPGGESQTSANVDFSFSRIAPMMIKFTNLSSGCTSYRWDFGDGTWSDGATAVHEFDKYNVDYPVTLTGTTSNGRQITARHTVKLTRPDIYITGVTYYAVPQENRYYRVNFKDDNWLPSSWDFYTQYTPMLSTYNLPYTYEFANPKELDNPEDHDYYTVIIYSNSSATGSGSDTKHLTIQMKVSDILKCEEELKYENNTKTTKVGIVFGYDY